MSPDTTGWWAAALIKKLAAEGYDHILQRTHSQLDLTDQKAVGVLFKKRKARLYIPGRRQSRWNPRQ